MRTTYFGTAKKTPMEDLTLGRSGFQQETMQAWEKFLDSGPDSDDFENKIRAEILDSWNRCTELGVNALTLGTPQKIGEEAVDTLQRKNRQLCAAAHDAFARLAPHLSESGAMMILTDQTGTIIHLVGDPETVEAGQEIQLELGGVWNETAIGTNGIGTALRTGLPTYVHASEHFCSGLKSWTCAGVPIFDPMDRSIIGVVDLSGPPQIYRPHNLALVVAAAREIEIALAEKQREERTQLLEAFIDLPKAHDSNDAIVLLNCSGRIVFSRNTDHLEQSPQGALPVGRRLLNFKPMMTNSDVAEALPPEIATKGVNLLKNKGETQGAALILSSGQDSYRDKTYQGITIPPRQGVEEDEISIVGQSPKMLEAIEFARRAAKANVAVLVQGETGVGKELFARLIHSHHAKENAPFIVVNCAAISGELIGGELFGHVAGAFTGALRDGKAGKFEQADGGVLCLDELGDMPPELQTYLLRTLEQRAVYRIGSDKRRAIDVQLVAMTNRNLRQDIEVGRFRRDLFYRIGTIVIDVPPLRERGNDIDLLIGHFNQMLCAKFERAELVFSPDALSALRAYRWPGNVRELRNFVERLCLLHQGDVVEVSDLPTEILEPDGNDFLVGAGALSPADRMDLDQIESLAIQRAIKQENGNLSKVASNLGISRPTLYRKIKQFELDRGK